MQFIDLKKQQDIIREKLDQRLSDVLSHGRYIMGPEVYELEEKLAEYVGVQHCISCSSGTDALLISLMAKGVGSGDAVFTTPFTYIATAEVISLVGATPVFVDIDPDTFNINPELISAAVQSARQKDLIPKAIIPVNLFGLPADYVQIKKLANENDLFVLEDAAQGFGGEIHGKKAGSFGHVAATSFFPAKPLGCYGDGGAIFTDDDNLLEIMKSIRVHGGGSNKYDNIRLGINGRLDTIQAAILLEKLVIFSDELIKRNTVAQYYRKNISKFYKVPQIPEGYVSSWAQYSILTTSKIQRKSLIKHLKKHNIPSMIYYKCPLHLQGVFTDLGYKIGDYSISEDYSDRILSIPMHPYLEQAEQDVIIEALNSFE
jgi:dTDP-4-amino-4,6-dideoxygalactose transaminase